MMPAFAVTAVRAAARGQAPCGLRAQSALMALHPTRRPARWLQLAAGVCVGAVALAGCASRSANVASRPTDPAAYAGWGCDRLHDEIDAVQQRAADVAYDVDSRVGNNMVALGLGVTVFWPALLAMRPDGLEAEELAGLKGRYEALRSVLATRGCAAPADTMAAQRQAALPVALGDRLVYEERAGNAGPTHLLGMQVTALRRDQIEFRVDLDGRAFDQPWRQDLLGNPVLEARAPLIGWRRLLKADLVLGQVLMGDLASAREAQPSARVRGQVVATGPQTVAGRSFDVAVIELFGEAPVQPGSTLDVGLASTRLDGVMAIDRRSGLLLRLDTRCANTDYALRRRLLRVEAAAR